MEKSKQALQNIRVLDLSRVLAGPYCTQMLGDLGADIIKVEQPFAGDDTRNWGPPYLEPKDGGDPTESAYYLSANRNKRSIAIDLKSPEGRAIIHDLLAQSDILIQNFKTGSLEKFGLGYEQLKEKHPSLIYCTITGFGQTGPMASEAGYDLIAQAMTGLMASTGAPDQPPTKVGVALSDIMAGLNAAIGILAALHHREKTGQGQLVDIALTDCTLASLTNLAQYYLTSGHVAPRVGNQHASIVPYQAFETANGHIVIGVGNNTQFKHLCDAIDLGDLPSHPDYATNSARVANRSALIKLLQDQIKTYTTQDLLDKLHRTTVPCGPVNTLEQAFATPQFLEREMKISMPHPQSDTPIDLVGSPLKLSETRVQYNKPPPRLGEHSLEILQNVLNYDSQKIEHLLKDNIIQDIKP